MREETRSPVVAVLQGIPGLTQRIRRHSQRHPIFSNYRRADLTGYERYRNKLSNIRKMKVVMSSVM
ncbi:MAG: hypothetical protein RMH74_07890 [Candidatus Caldarchaeum sp.]|nr:hypothetical protein [Candidatus Caldarchaeum sp.]